MPNLRLYTSNRLENLSAELARVISTPIVSPLDKEIIVIQSRGMERWLSMELARRHGICANISFPFPNAFVHEVMRKALPDYQEQSPFDPDIMAWRIMKLLPSLVTMSGFESLLTYLEDQEGGLKLFQLSERIADLFDQYLLFRPEMMLKWELGEKDHWQAIMWRELVAGHETQHRAALGRAFIKLLKNPSSQLEGLPERVAVFGISTLPRFHLQVFAALAKFLQVNLFLMNPCMEYWGDIPSNWEIKKAIDGASTQSFSAEDLHLENVNSLLASMGKLGRDFFDLINEFDWEDIQCFDEPGESNILTCIQSDILHLRERDQEAGAKKIVLENDSSVQIHSCHSPMREVEILQDRLLEMLESDPDLTPEDILVMTPDIEAYAPYIQAVFDIPANDSRRIPFNIADQSIRTEGRIVETFLAITRLRDGRFSASNVMAVLESRAVQERFGLSETDVDLIRKWVEDTRIRWGIDAVTREKMGLPGLVENTWKAGTDRLLLGYAMPGREESMFAGVLPFDSMEGTETSVLGIFLEFTKQLFSQTKLLDQARTLNEWSAMLKELLETFFMPDERTELEEQIVRRTLNNLAEQEDLSGFDEKVDMDVIRCLLEKRLQKEGFGFGFIVGGVTFCAILPMRSIPFKIICLMGMNGDSYPRQSKPLGFDLMAKNPQKGDRSRRNDDRYLFLEAVLSVREKLYISYVGQSIRDNTAIPPSVLVSEILDYIEHGFELHEKEIQKHIITEHRLQLFSTEYFKKDGKYFSYSRENFEVASCLAKPRKEPDPFISNGLSEPGDEWKTVDVDALCRFFVNPARFLLNKRLGIYIDEGPSALQETEPFEVVGLEKYLLAQDLLEKRLAGYELRDFFALKRASGLLPHGTVGECVYERLSQEIEGFAEMTGSYIREGAFAPLDVDLSVLGFRLTGRVSSIYPERMLRYRYAKIKVKDRLKAWIQHLVLNCLKPAGYPLTSMVVGLDKVWVAWEYLPVANAEDLLGKLLVKYWEGLTRPVHFFPESSWAYAQKVLEKKMSAEDALRNAYRSWMGGHYSVRGEIEDLYYKLCFRNTDPIDSEFQKTALEVFRPILGFQRKTEK